MPRPMRYRGRRGLSRVLSTLGVIILVVIVLSGTAYLFLSPYFSITEQGLLISLPFFNTGILSDPSPEPRPEPIDIIIETPEVSNSPEPPAPEPQPEPEPLASESGPRAVFLSQQALGSDRVAEIAALCESDVVDTVVLEVKSEDGALAAGKQELNDAVAALEGKARLIGYLSVLMDNTVTREKSTFAIKHTSGLNWLDADQCRWINPFLDDTREWLAAQVEAASALPFDALLLDNLSFPVNGRQQLIGWGEYESEAGPEGRRSAISALAERLTAASVIPCWAVLQTDVCTGGQPGLDNAAQDRELFEELFERVFVKLPVENPEPVYESILAYTAPASPPPVVIRLPEEEAIALGRFEGYIAVSGAGNYPMELFEQ